MRRLSVMLIALGLAFTATAEAGKKSRASYRWGKTFEYPLLYGEAAASPQAYTKQADVFPHHPMDGKRHWHNSRLYVYRAKSGRWEIDTF